MVEDEATKDHNVGGPNPSQGTRVRLDTTDVMSWDIESEIIHSLDIG